MPFPLVDYRCFDPIFEALRGRHLGRVEIVENPEDELLRHAVNALVDYYDIKGWRIEPAELEAGAVKQKWPDAFIVYGASASAQPSTDELRETMNRLSAGKPVIYLPGVNLTSARPPSPAETFYGANPAWRAWTRPAPEPTLALDGFFPLEPARQALGIFLRAGSLHDPDLSLGDPLHLCPQAYSYMRLATYFEHIVTDRLRFAIAGLIAGREVTLLPDRDGMNQSTYRQHLAGLGCHWNERAEPVDYDRRAVQRAELRLFCSSLPGKMERLATPLRVAGFDVRPKGEEAEISLSGGGTRSCTYSVFLLWSLCDGSRTVKDIIAAVADHVPGDIRELAADVDAGLNALLALKAIELRRAYTDTNGRKHYIDHHSAPVEVRVNPPRPSDGNTVFAADIRSPGGIESELWFEVPEPWVESVAGRADPFLLASLYTAMSTGRDLVVRGAVASESLLWNIDEYQRAWASRYTQCRAIRIDVETSGDAVVPEQKAITCYSGGVDSTFSVLHHLRDPSAARSWPLGAALLVLGLDIPAQDRDGFALLAASAARRLESVALPLVTMRTNIRTTCAAWETFHAPYLAASLSLYSGGFCGGLIPSTFHYGNAVIEGSNPITDHLLGSRSFPIVNDGATFTRFEKIEALATRWPEAIDEIRVCWRHPVRSRNCGRCWKCLQTAMSFRACGADPSSLGHVSDEDIDAYIRRAWSPPSADSPFNRALEAMERYDVRRPWLDTIRKKLGASPTVTSV